MVACVSTSDFAALVPFSLVNPDCDEIRAILFNWSNLVADQQECKYKENGDLTERYAQAICDLQCP